MLWLARFSPDKGPDIAIRACRAAGLPLLLAGKCNEPAERRYYEQVVAPMVDEDVTVVLNADRATTLRMLVDARCLIMPIQWDEPFGMVMLEAMATGTPVVALNRGAVPELVRPGLTGLVCRAAGGAARGVARGGATRPGGLRGARRARTSRSSGWRAATRRSIGASPLGRHDVREPARVPVR